MNLQQLKNLPRKHWLIIIGAATVVLAGVVIYFLFGSLRRLGDDPGIPGFMRRVGESSALYAQIAAKDTAIAEQNRIAAKFDERNKLLESMRADIDAARKRLPTDAQKAEVRQLIEDLGRQVGASTGALLVKSVSIREATPTKGRSTAQDYKSVEYQTTVTADFDGIIQFINLVERNERFMTIEGIQLTSGGVAVNKDTNKVEAKPHTAQLRIVTYIDTTGVSTGARRN